MKIERGTEFIKRLDSLEDLPNRVVIAGRMTKCRYEKRHMKEREDV